MLPSEFNAKDIANLSADKRQLKLRALESILNDQLAGCSDLKEWQARLYPLIDALNAQGFFLGRWDYDSEIETWGGPSYMDSSKEDDLLLRSEFPIGVKLAWKDYDQLSKNNNQS